MISTAVPHDVPVPRTTNGDLRRSPMEDRRRSRRRFRLGALRSWGPVIALTLAGCAHYRAIPFVEAGGASTVIEHREREGLHIAVRDLSERRTAMKHFGRDLRTHGFIPVMVLLEVEPGASRSFNVRREEIRLVLRNGSRLESADPEDVIQEVGFSHWRSLIGYLLLVPGPFVSSSVDSANSKLELDYTRKALRSIRLGPALRTHEGVVFFRMPPALRKSFSMEDSFVELVVHAEGDAQQGALGERFELPVHFSD